MLFGLVSSTPAKSQMGAATSPAANGGVAVHEVHSLSDEQAKEYELDRTFYKKSTLVHDILIISSKTVSDHAHLETAY